MKYAFLKMKYIISFSLLLISAIVGSCQIKKSSTTTMGYKYLALGDSYTIGESVSEAERWPNQLVAKVSGDKKAIFEPVEIIATTGWTTDELKSGIAKAAPEENAYDFVSLLIGVNNQYRGYPIADFEREFEELLNQAIAYAKKKENVFIVSIPDYGVTPFAASKDPEKIGEEVKAYNDLSKRIAEKYGIAFFDIYPISKKALNDDSYVADDKLHPSGKMYTEWADLIAPWLEKKVKQ